MRTAFLTTCFVAASVMLAEPGLRADQVEMQNGDRYNGRVLSMSADTVLFQSEVLGKIKLPRKNIANLAVSANAGASAISTNVSGITSLPLPPIAAPSASLANTNLDLSSS